MSAVTGTLVRKILNTLYREDYAGLRSAGWFAQSGANAEELHRWLVPLAGSRTLSLPLRPDGFLADYALTDAVIYVIDGKNVSEISDLETLFAELAPDPAKLDREAEAGWQEFRLEALQTELTLTAQGLVGQQLVAKLRAQKRPDTGFDGALQFEALATLDGHPVHPAGSCRWGMDVGEEQRYTPEYLPEFELQWITVPRETVQLSEALADLLAGPLPTWWPNAVEVNPDADPSMIAVPVHPLTIANGGPATVPGQKSHTGVTVAPTLSIRTVLLTDEPLTHLKMPLPIATLGRKNRRGIKAADLADGATMQQLLQEILDREPELAQRVLLADESRWLGSQDDSLALLVRSYPAELSGKLTLPLAALHVPDPSAADEQATLFDRLSEGDAAGWFGSYFRMMFDWHLALWLRYGVALESHQQNITIVSPGLQLLYKDNDGARVDRRRLSADLGWELPAETFNDSRIFISDPGELADMFTTITLHLCIATPIIAQAGEDRALRQRLFALARRELIAAMDRWTDPSDPDSAAAAQLLRERILDADYLPIKAMVTAGTLLPKARLGCQDINKYYLRTGPNYLRNGVQA